MAQYQAQGTAPCLIQARQSQFASDCRGYHCYLDVDLVLLSLKSVREVSKTSLCFHTQTEKESGCTHYTEQGVSGLYVSALGDTGIVHYVALYNKVADRLQVVQVGNWCDGDRACKLIEFQLYWAAAPNQPIV